jgi:hypothetical protein
MTISRRAALAAVLCAALSAFIAVRIARAQAAVRAAGQHLEGAWMTTVQSSGNPANFTLFTADGGFIAVPTGFTSSAAIGSWVRTGDRQFAVTQYRWHYDSAAGTRTGVEKIRWTLTLNDTLDGFTAPYLSDTLDLNGNVVSSGQNTLIGKRIAVEPVE